MNEASPKITSDTVRADFNDVRTVIHYARAAHFLGLWKSEKILIDRYFPDRQARLLEAGCGAGRVAVGLWHAGYHHVVAFDFAAEMIEQAENLAQEQGITGLTFLQADATNLRGGAASLPALDPSEVGAVIPNRPSGPADDKNPPRAVRDNGPHLTETAPASPGKCHLFDDTFDGVLFLFNGLMQIPGREHRRTALRELRRVCRAGAPFIFTTHDRDDPADLKEWAKEADRWARGAQDPRLHEFGDRYFSDETGNTFMHLPDRKEVLDDLAATGWAHVEDATRNELASETPRVRNFSDNCRFWVARKA
ncbi:MAG: class I SAM-dependent methyltransferase [Opitutae bacterium]|nr:class I SAM-dependent methyltransferase [Opitutae bacterium]